MTRAEAIKYLERYRNRKFRSIYQMIWFKTEALFALMPDFEYPDWSYRTVGEFLRKANTR